MGENQDAVGKPLTDAQGRTKVFLVCWRSITSSANNRGGPYGDALVRRTKR